MSNQNPGNFRMPFGEIGDCVWPEREGLLDEAANYLNESGVSVQGWPVYEIGG